MFSSGKHPAWLRCLPVGLALGLVAAAPAALAQKMSKCPDGKGGVVFQQGPCPETAAEIEARQKKREEQLAAEAKKKADDAKKKEEAAAMAKERDRKYLEEQEKRAAEAEKAKAAEAKVMEGTAVEKSDGTLTAEMEKIYPGPWKEGGHPDITATFAKKQIKGCEKFRHRQRTGGGPGEFLVHCTTDGGKSWVQQYFVWLASGAVRGPFKL